MNREKGLSIVELMISIAVGLLLTLAIASVYLANRQSYRLLENQVRIQDTARFVLSTVGQTTRSFEWQPTLGGGAMTYSLQNNWGGSGKDLFYGSTEYAAGDSACHMGLVTFGPFNSGTAFFPQGSELWCASSPAAVRGRAMASNVVDFQASYVGANGGGMSIATAEGMSLNGGASDFSAVRVCVTIQSDDDNLVTRPQRYLNCAGALGEASGSAAFTLATDRRLRRTFVATNAIRARITEIPQ